MLVLTFRVAEVPYAVAVSRVVEVVPRVALRELPHAPDSLAGMLRYRGKVVPVIDLGLLMGGHACQERLDTRIILVSSGLLGGADHGLVGLIAERVENIQTVEESRRALAGLEVERAPYLDSIYETNEGLLQLVEPSKILAGMMTVSPSDDGMGSS